GAGRPPAAVEPFETGFDCHPKSVRQTHFYLLGEKMIRRPVPESVSLIYSTEVKRPRRQHIGSRERGKSGAREPSRCAVGASDVVARNDDRFGLGASGFKDEELVKQSQANRDHKWRA